MTPENPEVLRGLVHASARFLDNRSYEDFVALFSEDGQYRIETTAPECPSRMTWMHLSRDELADRFEVAPQHEWKIASMPEQTRVISVDLIEIDETSAATSSAFCVFHTEEDGRSNCYAVGRYEDTWSLSDQGWRLSNRLVDLKTRMLSIPSPLPI